MIAKVVESNRIEPSRKLFGAVKLFPINKLGNSLVVGKYYSEEKHPISRRLHQMYQPVVGYFLKRPFFTFALAGLAMLSTIPAHQFLGKEFMPPLREGSLLYMPTALPGMSVPEASRLLQKQDEILKSFDEVESVFGKAGRANTSTDVAPLSMVETTVVLKPHREWQEKERWYSFLPDFLQPFFRPIWPDRISEEEPGSWVKTSIVLLSVPFSLVGAFWFLWILDYNVSIATWVGMIALMGLSAETGIFMLMYLDLAVNDRKSKGQMTSVSDLYSAVIEGSVNRIRPKTMIVMTAFLGLLPIMWSTGLGADVAKRVAAPMIGGLFTSFLLILLVYPVIYYEWKKQEYKMGARGF